MSAEARPNGAVISTKGLTKVYPTGVQAVVDLDLQIVQGELFGLLGPNGAGKTTTVGMLTTRVVPTSGRAYVAGIDVVRHPTAAKRVLGVVSQGNTLDRSLTVWQNLYFHGRYFGMGAARARLAADETLVAFRLTDRRDADVATLSGGMAQRLMVARGSLHRPPIMFLDEPTTGLDPQSRIAMWEILEGMRRAGQTILLTTHYMEEADRLCDRVAIMDHGRILALGSPDELKRSIGADVVVRLTAEGETERVAEHMRTFPEATGANAVDGAVHLTARSASGLLPSLIAYAESGGFRVQDLSVNEPTLETVFIHLTGKDLRE